MRPVDQIRQLTVEHGGTAAIVSHPSDLRWAVGFTGSNGLLVVTPTHTHLVTDGRYRVQARTEVQDASVSIADESLVKYAYESGLIEADAQIVVSSSRLTLAEYERYREVCTNVEFVPVRDLLTRAVAAKSEDQIEAVARAQRLTCSVFESLLPMIQPGVSELDLAAEIVYQHLKGGASAMSFEPIVASGERGAKPHARPSQAALENGDLVVIDMGCVLDGYCSDMTRTVAVGRPTPEAIRCYRAVQDAQRVAIEVAHAGMSGKELDRIARSVLEDAGLGEAFSHSLGHGVGLEVHEWPRLSSRSDDVLPPSATVTVEPGVYINGEFGIRIEDVIALREGGNDNLTPLGTDLVTV